MRPTVSADIIRQGTLFNFQTVYLDLYILYKGNIYVLIKTTVLHADVFFRVITMDVPRFSVYAEGGVYI